MTAMCNLPCSSTARPRQAWTPVSHKPRCRQAARDAVEARLDALPLRDYLPFLPSRGQAQLPGRAQQAIQAASKAAEDAQGDHKDLPRLFCPGRLLYIRRLGGPPGGAVCASSLCAHTDGGHCVATAHMGWWM